MQLLLYTDFLYWMSKVICHNKGFTCYFTDYYIASYSYIFFLPAALWNNRMSGGGYDYDFMTSLPAWDRLICKVCHFPSQDPCLSLCCGHTFCKSCSDATWNTTKVCLTCRNNHFYVVQNKQNDRENLCISFVQARWKAVSGRVNWTTSIITFKMLMVVSLRKWSVPITIERWWSDNNWPWSHVETECPRCKVNCQYCHDTGEHQFIEGQYKEECPKLLYPVPTSVMLRISFVKIWRHTRRNVS